MIAQPAVSKINKFGFGCQDITDFDLQGEFFDERTRIDQIRHMTSFDQINKFESPQFLCSLLFPEGVDLRTNASGFINPPMVPSNDPSYIKI